jgi:2-keto-4-pentenoate hydratase
MPRSNRVREVLQPAPGVLLLVAACFCLAAGATALRDAPADRLAEARARQQALVAAWPASERVAGYKSAFNSPQMQQRFGLDRPAFAVLPASAERCAGLAAGCAVSRAGYGRMVMEIEVAFRLGAAVTQPLADEAALLARIDGVMPAVELPELALDGIAAPTGLDYIASNIGVRGYILGAARDPALLQGTAPSLTLARGATVLAQGKADGALAAALELVNAAVAAGHELRAGQVLLSGAVGGMAPAEPGDYVADCGALGTLRFTVR